MERFAFILFGILFSIIFVQGQHFAKQNQVIADDLSFDYQLVKTRGNNNLILVNAEIWNKSNDDIYFLAESCNNLDYYISANHPKVSSHIIVKCQITEPVKKKIQKKSSYRFQVYLTSSDSDFQALEIQLKLKLFYLDKAYRVEGKTVQEIVEKEENAFFELTGEKVKVEQFTDL